MSGPLAIFGGTFDPVHVGHLRVAWEAAEALDAVVHLVPCAEPPHRGAPRAAAHHRLAMLALALAGQQRLVADGRELARPGPSYTVDTLAGLRSELGPDRALVLIVGADAFAGFPRWHRWREIFALAHVAVLTRPGHGGVFEPELAGEWYQRRRDDPRELAQAPGGCIAALEVSALEISASAIRAELVAGREPRFLVPDPVLDYIRVHRLYRTPD